MGNPPCQLELCTIVRYALFDGLSTTSALHCALTLKEDLQIGDNIYRAEHLEEDAVFSAPWNKTRIPWRNLQPVEGAFCIYTDGSKKEDRVGSAIVLLQDNVEIHHQHWRLNDEATVFMAELHAIKKAIEYIASNSFLSVKIISDSRSVLMALDNPANNSPAILHVKQLLQDTPSKIEMQPTCGGVAQMFVRAARVHGARAWGSDRFGLGLLRNTIHLLTDGFGLCVI
ncbi:RNase H domain-containing protein [Caerostris extrusa]|uniref:RNase H domain-containing protein n=1 Tax=Caerostris extrusa TaxID=172846 RepID=A0AAV4NQC3_CAEEX|nr:RNase H domain-containing protein [Caerostris extrusa]